MMAWAGSNRRAQLPPNWTQLREAVRTRAGGRCEANNAGGRCTAAGTDCDHRIPGNDHSMNNLQWLCRPCHKTKTSNESLIARGGASRKRPTARPPGVA